MLQCELALVSESVLQPHYGFSSAVVNCVAKLSRDYHSSLSSLQAKIKRQIFQYPHHQHFKGSCFKRMKFGIRV